MSKRVNAVTGLVIPSRRTAPNGRSGVYSVLPYPMGYKSFYNYPRKTFKNQKNEKNHQFLNSNPYQDFKRKYSTEEHSALHQNHRRKLIPPTDSTSHGYTHSHRENDDADYFIVRNPEPTSKFDGIKIRTKGKFGEKIIDIPTDLIMKGMDEAKRCCHCGPPNPSPKVNNEKRQSLSDMFLSSGSDIWLIFSFFWQSLCQFVLRLTHLVESDSEKLISNTEIRRRFQPQKVDVRKNFVTRIIRPHYQRFREDEATVPRVRYLCLDETNSFRRCLPPPNLDLEFVCKDIIPRNSINEVCASRTKLDQKLDQKLAKTNVSVQCCIAMPEYGELLCKKVQSDSKIEETPKARERTKAESPVVITPTRVKERKPQSSMQKEAVKPAKVGIIRSCAGRLCGKKTARSSENLSEEKPMVQPK